MTYVISGAALSFRYRIKVLNAGSW